MRSTVLLSTLALALPRVATSQAPGTAPMRQVQEIVLSGVHGPPGHFTADRQRKHVIFSVPGDGTVQIVDAFDGSKIHQIDGLAKPQDVFYLADGDKLYIASSANGRVDVLDGGTFTRRAVIDFGGETGGLQYDPVTKRLYVSHGADAIDAIDVATDKRLNLNLKSKVRTGRFQVEPKRRRILANAPGEKAILTLDLSTSEATAWPLPRGSFADAPLELDGLHHRLFIGGGMPAQLTVLDTESGRTVASLPCPGGADGLFYDAERRRVYVLGAEGFLTVFQQTDADHYVAAGRFPTAAGARTGLWYPNRDQLYVATPAAGNKGARLLVFEAD